MQQFPGYPTSYENTTTQQSQIPQSQSNHSQDHNQQQPQQQSLLTGHNLAIYSPANMQPLSVLAAAQRKDQDPNTTMATVAPVAPVISGGHVEMGSHGKPKRNQVKNACVNCQKACKKCDIGRPCQRCIKYGLEETCINSVRKERKKGIKRGPYKKRNKTDAENSASEGSTPKMVSPLANAPMYGNNVRPATIPIHYQSFSPGHYDPYAAYTNNGQMMPQAYMVPASIQQMYHTNPPPMSYQAAMNIISPQHQQQTVSPQQSQQPQSAEQLQQPQQQNNAQQQVMSATDGSAPSSATAASTSASEPKADDDEGSKLTLLSRLCSAVLDRNDAPKQVQEVNNEGNQEIASPHTHSQSANS